VPNEGRLMNGRHRKKDWDGSGNDSFSPAAMTSDYDHVTGELTKRRHNKGLGISSSGGGGFDFSGITAIGLGYDSFTGIRPKNRRGNMQIAGE
jgi:hypothetical protein